jgi:hypothetical protein
MQRVLICLGFVVLTTGCGGNGATTPSSTSDASDADDAASFAEVSGDDALTDGSSVVDVSDVADVPSGPPVSANALVFMHGNLEFVPENNPKGCSVAAIGPGWHSDLDGFYRNPVLALVDAMKLQHPIIDMPIGDGSCSYPWSTHPSVNPEVWKKPHVAMSGFSSGRDGIWEFFIDHKGAIPPTLDCVVMYDPCVDADNGAMFDAGTASMKAWLAASSAHVFTMVEGGCAGADYATVGNDFKAKFAGLSNFHLLNIVKSTPTHFATLSDHLDLQWTAGCPALADMPGP